MVRGAKYNPLLGRLIFLEESYFEGLSGPVKFVVFQRVVWVLRRRVRHRRHFAVTLALESLAFQQVFGRRTHTTR